MSSKWIVERICFDGDCIYNTEEQCYYAYDKQDLERVCEILNNLENSVKELQEENEHLKQYLKYLEYRFTEYRNKRG